MEFLDIFVYFATMIGIYSILSLSLNLQYGFGGLVNFGLVAFFATGAYTGALLALKGVSFLWGIVAAGLASAMLGVVVALPTSKLSVSYWAIATLGIGEVVRLFLLNEEWLTKGSFGIAGIPRPWEDFWGDTYYSFFYLFFVWFFVGLAYVFIRRLSNSPFGRILKAIREEDDLALAMGKPVFVVKLKTMALGAALTGIAGTLYAYYITP